MNRKEFILGLAGITATASIGKCIADNKCNFNDYNIYEYAHKAAYSYMLTYTDYPNCGYSGVAPVGIFYYKCDGKELKTVFTLPTNVRRSYIYSKDELYDKLVDWFYTECYRCIDKNKGHTITFDVVPFLARKA